MTAYEPALHRSRHRLLRWLGLADAASRTIDPLDPPPPTSEVAGGRRANLRGQLLQDIAQFHQTHALEVTPFTLEIAHDYLTGADHQLLRRIDARVAERQPVTLEWLETIGFSSQSELDVLRELMKRFEQGLDEFGRTSHDAGNATRQYGKALAAHVDELEGVSKAGAVITELASIARTMLSRTREIERDMKRSEQQTRLLRQRLDEARRSAEIDHLTGLPNRRAFEKRFAAECREAADSGETMCVAFCDIDRFKAINDTHGHDAGDRVLTVVAQTLARISDDRCHVARHGGEEFVVLLRGLTPDQAVVRLDAARTDLAARKLVNRATGAPFGVVTFSAGIAEVGAFENRSAALKAADAALYRAKQEGRNRIALARAADAT